MIRKTTAVLAAVLCCSVALNVFLFGRMCALSIAHQRSQKMLAAKGHHQGIADAQRDFAAGTPKWYQVGDFAAGVPSNKAGRAPATVGCLLTGYERPYVDAYNSTMDELFEEKETQP